MRTRAFIFAVIIIVFCCVSQTNSFPLNFPSDSTVINFEDLPPTSPIVLDDQFLKYGIDFNSSMKSYRLDQNAPGVNPLSGIRTASPDDSDPSDFVDGYRRAPVLTFIYPVHYFGLYLTDGIDRNWLFRLEAFDVNGSTIGSSEIQGVVGAIGESPVFISIVSNQNIASVRLRLYDPINNNVPVEGTNSFEIDDLIFSSSWPVPSVAVPEPSTMLYVMLGLVGLHLIRRKGRSGKEPFFRMPPCSTDLGQDC